MDLGVDDPLISGEAIWRGLMLLGMIVAGVVILRLRRAGADGLGWRTRLERMRGREIAVTDQGWRAAYDSGWRYIELGGWVAIAAGFLALAPVQISVVTTWVLLGAGVALGMVMIGVRSSFWAAREPGSERF